MRKIAMFLLTIAYTIILVACSPKQDGFVEFSVEGEMHRIENMQFSIRANPLFGEGERVKIIPKGVKNQFAFSIGPTVAEAKKQLKATGKELKSLAKGETPKGEGYYSFDAVWVAETIDPEGILKSRVTLKNQRLGLTHFYIIITVPGRTIRSPEEWRHNCWIEVDEITKNRVKGRFGGLFVTYLTGKELEEELRLGLKSEIEKEIQITDGTFDVPYRKLYRYE